MLLSEVNELLRFWFLGDPKVFKVTYSFSNPDVLIIFKKDESLYEVDLANSTTRLFTKFTKDEITKNLSSGKLVYFPNYNNHINYNVHRAGQCECGAWATLNPSCHSDYCPLYSKPQGSFG